VGDTEGMPNCMNSCDSDNSMATSLGSADEKDTWEDALVTTEATDFRCILPDDNDV
jgi:hypothetical protein